MFILPPDTNPSSAQVTFVKVVNATGGVEEVGVGVGGSGQQQQHLEQQQPVEGSAQVQDQILSSSSSCSPPLEEGPGDGSGALGPVTRDEILEGDLGVAPEQQLQDEVGQDEVEDEYVPQDVVTLDLTAGAIEEEGTEEQHVEDGRTAAVVMGEEDH